MQYDLSHAALEIREGRESASRLMELSIAAAQSPLCAHVFSQTFFDSARWAAAETPRTQPLAGLAVSIKDLFDMQGSRSAASSKVLRNAPLAESTATAVARLQNAGAALIGRTHMVEFAFSGVGVNPHFGTPAALDACHPANPQLAPTRPARIPGGSSSGAAVSVASGAAWAALGSDTGGSIRIPAALNGIVGFKNTARLVPTAGAVPLSTTLDTACAMTRTVGDAIVAHEVLAARRVTRSLAPLSQYRLAVPSTLFLDGLDATVASAFERSVEALRQAGAQIDTIALPAVLDQPAYGFAAPEAYAWHRALLQRAGDRYDPRVRMRIEKGATLMAGEYIDLLQARQQWIARMLADMEPYDALLSPTVPIVAPLLADVAPADGVDKAQDAARDAEFFRVNNLLLRNTSVVNLLDGCALSLPCHVQGELPVGLMVWHGALRDDTVLNISLQVEQTLQK